MNPLRALARPLLSAGFIAGGLDQLLDTHQHAEAATGLVNQLADTVPAVPNDPVKLVRINGAVMVASGVMLSFGKVPRLAACALACTMVPTTLTQHRFWAEKDPHVATLKRQLFIKNVAMLGGAILATTGPGGQKTRRPAAPAPAPAASASQVAS